ncbi:hypothetical protein P8625_09095 [Tenacibaculum tangerinum]|uniref:Arginyl-tRNA synthetase n=1 Tax=Tenacibaculum tangerinum TaxID=3038772 RepID=A0ABY8KYG1_9FLAO|nr:hypothetical protein [Tenacibaculum tangerinum]WGH74272.1 hypothetical protein P8625_09095 [Tenacibaculum tangerinum]
MLFNVTHTNKENQLIINHIVGARFNFFKSIKLNGIGSGKMIIEEVSENFKELISDTSDLNYGNIELRPGGILVFVTKKLQRFCWTIPYYKLVVYKNESFSIYADANFIRFRKDKNYRENQKFIRKMMNLKIAFKQEYAYDR